MARRCSIRIERDRENHNNTIRQTAKPRNASAGRAWAAGWNDKAAGKPLRDGHEVEFAGYTADYELGRLHAAEAWAAGGNVPMWSGNCFTKWHPDVLTAVARGRAAIARMQAEGRVARPAEPEAMPTRRTMRPRQASRPVTIPAPTRVAFTITPTIAEVVQPSPAPAPIMGARVTPDDAAALLASLRAARGQARPAPVPPPVPTRRATATQAAFRF